MKRKILGVAEVRLPAMAGDEAVRRWKAALYEDSSFEFWSGEEDEDLLDPLEWFVTEPPAQVRTVLEYLCTWVALPRDTLSVPSSIRATA